MGYSRLTTQSDNRVHTSMSLVEVSRAVVNLERAGYRVAKLYGTGSEHGYSSEVDGWQIFRASQLGNERYHVRYDERFFADV